VKKTIASLFLWSALLACKKESNWPVINLTVIRVSDNSNFLTWNPIINSNGYKIWRIVKFNDGQQQIPGLLKSVDFLTLEYLDNQLPLDSEVQYYITTTKDGNELKSNPVQTLGAAGIDIIPYQMELIPENNLAVIRGYSDIYVLDYQKQIIVAKRTFNGQIGTIDIGTYSGKKELYVPCSDNNVYICDVANLEVIETLVTRAPAKSVAVNSNGLIFVSGQDFNAPLTLFKRDGLGFVSKFSGYSNAGLSLQSDTKLISISTAINPPDMSIYSFTNEGTLIAREVDSYGYDYEMDGTRMKVNERYVVTSTKGAVYSITNGIVYLGAISASANLTDFEFSEDGNSIYCAVTDRKQIIKSTLINGQLSPSSISTKGFPWIIARAGNTLIILSSPKAFTPYILTNNATLEKITIN
jgi:hypothetical protein